MRTLFVDTNVILDVLLQNEGFWEDSYRVFQLAEIGQARVCVSASSMTDVFYVARKKLTAPVARDAIGKLLDLFTVIGVDGADLRNALSLPIEDMEDALQAWCATKAGADEFITRDIDGFSEVSIPVITPAEVLLP